MKLSREKILRMFDGTGGSSGGGGDIDGYASESWVGSKYLSKDFIAQTINWYDGTDIVIPNDTKSDIDLIEFAVNASFRGNVNVLGNLTMAGRLVATQEWVGRNYVSISFFDSVFQVFNNTTKIAVNGDIPADTSKMNIKAMFGFWTDFYVTALGNGGQISSAIYLSQLADVNVSGVSNGQALIYNSSTGKWVAGTPAVGTVTSVGLSAPTGFTVSGSPITGHGTLTLTYASGYSLPTTAKQNNWDTAFRWGNHATAGYLTASSPIITTLQGYFDGNGNAKSALKLTTVNKTAWGQTYWTRGGVPTSISGNMTDVGNITMNGSNRINPNGNALYIGNENNASWVFISDCCSSDGSSWKIRHGGNADFANVYSAGYVTALSDLRDKIVIEELNLETEEIANAPLIKFRWKDGRDDVLHVGSVAQYWLDVLPEAVPENEAGRLVMDYGAIALISAVTTAKVVMSHEERIRIIEEKLFNK